MNRHMRGFSPNPAFLFLLLLAAGLLLEGCLTASTQGLDRAGLSARAGIRRCASAASQPVTPASSR